MLKEREKDNVKFSFMFKEEVSATMSRRLRLAEALQLPGYHLYRSTLSSRYRIPTPPPEAFEDEVSIISSPYAD